MYLEMIDSEHPETEVWSFFLRSIWETGTLQDILMGNFYIGQVALHIKSAFV